MPEKGIVYLLMIVVSHHPIAMRPLWTQSLAACTHAAKTHHLPAGACLRTHGPLPHPSLNDGQ
jgi:hypothetical protein